jgi:glyoxylase-like metal-dependent hydrolase (beta-lactamase superfamily II)
VPSTPASASVREIDLDFLGTANAICTFADLEGGWLVDPGPESTHGTLLAALPDDWVPRRILLTHIHFDHAGATGRLLERWPDAEVWVHERGARHLIDPERLVASATRVYGDDFDRLWGAVVPVPAGNVRALAGGETIDGWRVAYTPGHASHHVSYLSPDDGTAFTGDVAGVRVGEGPALPPTPPPDIDRERWAASLDTLSRWAPTALRVTHFGTFTDVDAHLDEMREGLAHWSELARGTDADGFGTAFREHVAQRTEDPQTRASYDSASPSATLWGGWDRYWQQRDARG